MFGLHSLFLQYLSLGKISGLYRHGVKGLSADSLEEVHLARSDAFPDDRRFALMKQPDKAASFDPQNPEWFHKENFLCAFSAPELMAKYRASYSMQVIQKDGQVAQPHGVPCDSVLTYKSEEIAQPTKVLELYERCTNNLILGPIDLNCAKGRKSLELFFTKASGVPLKCVTADKHQFGNTSSGWKQNKDSRTVHIVNESTVKALEDAINNPSVVLNPTRFRPNIVLTGSGLEPFSEWDWIGKSIQCGSATLKVISKTVRCEGVNIDPLDDRIRAIDIPGMLVKHFPEHGPYLGVYAVVESEGKIALNDDVTMILKEKDDNSV